MNIKYIANKIPFSLQLFLSKRTVRCVLYVFAAILLFAPHWLIKYGFFISSFSCTGYARKSSLVFFKWIVLRPVILTCTFLLIEKVFFKKLTTALTYLPLFFLLLGSLRYFFHEWHELVEALLLLMALTLYNWQLLIIYWKKYILLLLGLCLLGFSFWTQRYIGEANIDQLLSTFLFNVHGLFSVDSLLVTSFMLFSFIVPFAGLLLIIVFISSYTSKIKPVKNLYIQLFSCSIMLTACIFIGNQYSLFEFITNLHQQTNQDYFLTHYKNPEKIGFKVSSKPKNLVFIYVESLESTYQDSGLFGRDLLSSLTQIQATKFSKFIQAPGTGWSIAGLVASQCGIPLKAISVFNGNRVGELINQFLPGAMCLSDVLARLGYQNIYFKGGALNFAGFDTFLRTHQYSEILGKKEWLQQGEGKNMSSWGLTDDLLFSKAKLKLSQLMKGKQPFNLTLFTVDTHGYDGTINKTCHERGVSDFQGIVTCSAEEIADFIHFIDEQGWGEQIIVAVIGDHLAMKNPLSDKIALSPTRSIFNMIISPDAIKKNREDIFHVDFFPTILHLLGIQWSDDRLALGYSAIAAKPQSVASDERLKVLEQIYAFNSPSYNQLWLKSFKAPH